MKNKKKQVNYYNLHIKNTKNTSFNMILLIKYENNSKNTYFNKNKN